MPLKYKYDPDLLIPVSQTQIKTQTPETPLKFDSYIQKKEYIKLQSLKRKLLHFQSINGSFYYQNEKNLYLDNTLIKQTPFDEFIITGKKDDKVDVVGLDFEPSCLVMKDLDGNLKLNYEFPLKTEFIDLFMTSTPLQLNVIVKQPIVTSQIEQIIENDPEALKTGFWQQSKQDVHITLLFKEKPQINVLFSYDRFSISSSLSCQPLKNCQKASNEQSKFDYEIILHAPIEKENSYWTLTKSQNEIWELDFLLEKQQPNQWPYLSPQLSNWLPIKDPSELQDIHSQMEKYVDSETEDSKEVKMETKLIQISLSDFTIEKKVLDYDNMSCFKVYINDIMTFGLKSGSEWKYFNLEAKEFQTILFPKGQNQASIFSEISDYYSGQTTDLLFIFENQKLKWSIWSLKDGWLNSYQHETFKLYQLSVHTLLDSKNDFINCLYWHHNLLYCSTSYGYLLTFKLK